jgi:hypothetical protein
MPRNRESIVKDEALPTDGAEAGLPPIALRHNATHKRRRPAAAPTALAQIALIRMARNHGTDLSTQSPRERCLFG